MQKMSLDGLQKQGKQAAQRETRGLSLGPQSLQKTGEEEEEEEEEREVDGRFPVEA